MSIFNPRWPKKKPPPPAPAPVEPPITVVPADPSQPIRVTSEMDGEILNRGYSYWSQVWHRGEDVVFAFVGHADGHPRFFRIEGTAITRLGSLVPYGGTGEGWAWTAQGDVMLCDGPRLRRVNPFTGVDVVVLDISQTHPGCRLFQAHSDDAGETHSATVEQIVDDGKYPALGTVVQVRGEQRWYRAEGHLDESHVTPDGHWLLIKELEVAEDYNTLYNRIISLVDGTEHPRLSPQERIGHSDCGPGFVIGEDSNRGWIAKFDFATRERVKLLDTWAMGGVSYRGGRCLRSSANALSLVALDGSGERHLIDHGMIGDPKNYEFQCRANLSPDGSVAAWVSNAEGRMHLYVLRLP